MNNIKVAPSILSGDFAKMGETVRKVNEWGADYVHVDVMDGSFVPNITFGMPMVKAIKSYSDIPLDVHLMIVNPEKYVAEFVDAGADIVTFHPNATDKTQETLDIIHSKGARAGLVLNPDIPASAIEPYIESIDNVTLMGVFPGFGGQKYIESVTEKIYTVADMLKKSGRNIELELDGGVTEGNIDELLAAGVNVVVGGSSVFKSADPAATVIRLRG